MPTNLALDDPLIDTDVLVDFIRGKSQGATLVNTHAERLSFDLV